MSDAFDKGTRGGTQACAPCTHLHIVLVLLGGGQGQFVCISIVNNEVGLACEATICALLCELASTFLECAAWFHPRDCL